METFNDVNLQQRIEEKRKNQMMRTKRFRDKQSANGLKEIRNIYASDEHEPLIRGFAEGLKT